MQGLPAVITLLLRDTEKPKFSEHDGDVPTDVLWLCLEVLMQMITMLQLRCLLFLLCSRKVTEQIRGRKDWVRLLDVCCNSWYLLYWDQQHNNISTSPWVTQAPCTCDLPAGCRIQVAYCTRMVSHGQGNQTLQWSLMQMASCSFTKC